MPMTTIGREITATNKKIDDARETSSIFPVVFFAFLFGAKGAILPYMPIYFYELGFTGLQTGMLFGSRSFLTLFLKLAWSSVSRRIASGAILKMLLMSSISLMLILKLGLVLAPVMTGESQDMHCLQPLSNATGNKKRAVVLRNYETGPIGYMNAQLEDSDKQLSSNEPPLHLMENTKVDEPYHALSASHLDGKIRQNHLRHMAKGGLGPKYKAIRPQQSLPLTGNGHPNYEIQNTRKYQHANSKVIFPAQKLFIIFICITIAECFLVAPIDKIAEDFFHHYMEKCRNDCVHKRLHVCSSVALATTAVMVSFLSTYIGCSFPAKFFSIFYQSHLTIMFVVFFVFGVVSIILAHCIPFSSGIDKINVIRGLRVLRKDPSHKLITYAITVSILGMSNASTYIFILWKLQQLHGQDYIVGGMVAVATTSELFMLYAARKFIIDIPIHRLFTVCIFMQGLRLLIYPFLPIPLLFIPMELMFMCTNTLLWIALHNHIEYVCPPSRENEASFVIQTTFWEAGCCIGSIASGLIYDFFGIDNVFLAMASFTFLWLLVFIIVIASYRCIPSFSSGDLSHVASKWEKCDSLGEDLENQFKSAPIIIETDESCSTYNEKDDSDHKQDGSGSGLEDYDILETEKRSSHHIDKTKSQNVLTERIRHATNETKSLSEGIKDRLD